jgi:hypothetical protein
MNDLGGYGIQRRVLKESVPIPGRPGGFTRQELMWDVIAPGRSEPIRSFKGRDGKGKAQRDIQQRLKRKNQIQQAKHEASQHGSAVVGGRGRSPVTVYFDPSVVRT